MQLKGTVGEVMWPKVCMKYLLEKHNIPWKHAGAHSVGGENARMCFDLRTWSPGNVICPLPLVGGG